MKPIVCLDLSKLPLSELIDLFFQGFDVEQELRRRGWL